MKFSKVRAIRTPKSVSKIRRGGKVLLAKANNVEFTSDKKYPLDEDERTVCGLLSED